MVNSQSPELNLSGLDLAAFVQSEVSVTEKLYSILQKLNLAHNRIHLFKFDRLKDNLQFLDLSSNQLKSIDGNIFPKNLKILRLRDNRIETIPELPEGLEEFDISDNKLKILPNYLILLEIFPSHL